MAVEQYVPEEFQDEIDLPAPGMVDQEAVGGATRNLASQKAKAKHAQALIDAYRKGKAATKNKVTQAAYQKKITDQQKVLDAANKAATGYQGDIYKATGQFDKLLTGDQRDAYAALQSLFNTYGLGSLAGKIFDYVKQGYGADTIGLLLQDTKEYKERFAANETRKKAGLPVLSPAEYLSAESAYRQILSAAGLPKGFYDNAADFRTWIAGDVSPTEVKSRVDMAVEATTQANPAYKQALKALYGVDEKDLTAFFLDRKKAEPLLKKQAAAASIGAAAIQRGFEASPYSEFFATEGVTAEQAQQGYALIADTFDPLRAIAARYGMTWTQGEAERDVFEPGKTPGTAGTGGNSLPYTSESSTEKRKRLASQERALFAGRGGSSVQGLSGGYRQT